MYSEKCPLYHFTLSLSIVPDYCTVLWFSIYNFQAPPRKMESQSAPPTQLMDSEYIIITLLPAFSIPTQSSSNSKCEMTSSSAPSWIIMSTTKLSVNCVPTYFPHLRHSVTLWWSYSNINWCLPSARILNIWCSCSHSGDLGLMHEEWLRHLQSRSGIVEQFTTKMVIRTVNSDYIASFDTNKQYQTGMVLWIDSMSVLRNKRGGMLAFIMPNVNTMSGQ